MLAPQSDSATPWTIACQAPLSMGFPKQEYRSGLPFPSPAELPEPGIEPRPLLVPEAVLSPVYGTAEKWTQVPLSHHWSHSPLQS